MIFKDRFDAAKKLAERLKSYKDNKDVVIIAIPRGALQIGAILAKELHAPLDIVLTKKIGAPRNPEFAIGFVSLEDHYVSSEFAEEEAWKPYINKEIDHIRAVLKERYKKYKGEQKPLLLKDKIVIVTDDGIATGNTLIAALKLIRKQNPKKIVVAVPVGPKENIGRVAQYTDEMICLEQPPYFYAIGQFYEQFAQVEDDEAIRLLHESQQ